MKPNYTPADGCDMMTDWKELIITKEREVDLNQYGRRSKYRYIYARIERELNDEWLIIDTDSVREAQSIYNSVHQRYGFTVEKHIRKYNEGGYYRPQVYLRKDKKNV